MDQEPATPAQQYQDVVHQPKRATGSSQMHKRGGKGVKPGMMRGIYDALVDHQNDTV